MLNIKNPRVYRLARRASEVTGLSMTAVIEDALERLLLAYGEDATEAEVSARVERVQRLVDLYSVEAAAGGGLNSVEDLFDETGLPR